MQSIEWLYVSGPSRESCVRVLEIVFIGNWSALYSEENTVIFESREGKPVPVKISFGIRNYLPPSPLSIVLFLEIPEAKERCLNLRLMQYNV